MLKEHDALHGIGATCHVTLLYLNHLNSRHFRNFYEIYMYLHNRNRRGSIQPL